MAAAIIAAIILGAQNIQATQAILAASVAGNAQTQLNFTRAHEEEADRVGIQLLADAGFDPRAMPAFFERLQKRSRLYDSGVPEFLVTHPVTLTRISDSRNRAEQYQYRQVSDSTDYYLAKAKLQVLGATNSVQLVKQYEDSLKKGKYRNKFAEQYGYALALFKNDEARKAKEIISQLLHEDSERVAYFISSVEIDLSTNQLQSALTTLSHALDLYPHNSSLSILYARANLESDQNDTAEKLLRDQTRYDPENPTLYKLLAQAEKKSGKFGEAHEALAEYNFLTGAIYQAIEQLQLSLQQEDLNQYDKERIQARLKQLKQEAIERQELLKEEPQ
jgi:predicted Zn-dependent protease